MNRATPVNNMKPGFQHVAAEEIHLTGIREISVLGDPGCTGFNEDSQNILGSLLKHKPDLFFMLGDFAFIGTEEEFLEVISFCNSRANAPIFPLCGNHDTVHYRKFFGLPTYAVVTEDRVFVFLYNAGGFFSDHEIAFLKKELDAYSCRDFFIFMHIPPPTDIHRSHMPRQEWERLKAVLDPCKEKIRHIFCAHIHGYHTYELDGYRVTVSAGGGAAMIYDLKNPGQRLHHAIKLTLQDSRSAHIDIVIP